MRRRGTAQDGPDAAPELADQERLRDVVVRAELEPEHLVELVVARGEHDDRDGALRADPLADLEPVDLREHDVEHDEVDLLLARSAAAPPRRRAPGRRDSRPARAGTSGASGSRPRRRRAGWLRSRASSGHSIRGCARGRSYYSPRRGDPRFSEAARPADRPRIGVRQRSSPPARADDAPTNRSTAPSSEERACSSLRRCSSSRFTIATPGPFPASTLPPAFDGGSATASSRRSSRATSPTASRGRQGALGAAGWVKEKLALYGLPADRGRVGRDDSRARHGTTPQPRHRRPRCEHRRDPRSRPPRQHRQRPRRQRQRLGHGGSDRARARVRPARHDRRAADARAHADLPLLRRRRVRRLRRRAVRGNVAAPGRRARRGVARRARGHRSAPARDRGVRAALACPGARAHGRRPGRGRARRRTGVSRLAHPARRISGCRSATASRHRFSGARSPLCASTTADDDGDDADRRHGRAARSSSVRHGSAAPPSRSSPSLDSGIELAGGTDGSRLPRLPHRSRLGDRVRPPRRARSRFSSASIDLFARSRRRRLPLSGRLAGPPCTPRRLALDRPRDRRSARSQGCFPRGSAIPPPPDSPAVTDWPVVGLALHRRLRRRSAGGAPAALSSAGRRRRATTRCSPGTRSRSSRSGRSAIATAVDQPLRPALRHPVALRVALAAAGRAAGPAGSATASTAIGLAGPRSPLVAIGTQLGLGLDTPLYLVSLMTLGFIPWTTVLVLIAWAAVATQLGALAAGRYAPVARRDRPVRERPQARPQSGRKRTRDPAGASPSHAGSVRDRVGRRQCATIMCDS